MTEMFGEAWSPMSVPDLAPDDDDDPFASLYRPNYRSYNLQIWLKCAIKNQEEDGDY